MTSDSVCIALFALPRFATGRFLLPLQVVPPEVVEDIYSHALRKQTGVSLKYMLDFGSNPFERQMVLSAQFLQNELPIRLAHRVAELENLPYGLSSKKHILKAGARDGSRRATPTPHTLTRSRAGPRPLRGVVPGPPLFSPGAGCCGPREVHRHAQQDLPEARQRR